MGWTSYYATEFKNGKVDRLAECRKELGRGYDILKDAMVGTTYYAAMRSQKSGKIFVLVALTSVCKNAYGSEFAYKDMEACVGPCAYDCPESILKMNADTSPYAIEWVEKNREKRRKKREFEAFLKKAEKEGTMYISSLPFDTTLFPKGAGVRLEYDRERKDWMVAFYHDLRFPKRLLAKVGIENLHL